MRQSKRILAFVLIAFALTFCGCKPKKHTSEEVFSICKDSVVEITTFDKKNKGLSLGTGFVISKDGLIITNYHVIKNAYSIIADLNGTKYEVETIEKYDKQIDLAVLKINADNLSFLKLSTDNYTDGSTVYAIGSSEGYTLSFSSGVISSKERVFDNVKYIQHSSPISHGNSGGPLLNEYCEVIGINTSSNIDGQNLNFAIKVEELDKLSDATRLSMSSFYQKEGPYYDTFIGDYNVYELEPNNTLSAAQRITVNGSTVNGNLSHQYDMDFYSIGVKAGQELSVFFIPNYAMDASGIYCALLDRNENIIEVATKTTVLGITLKGMFHTNNSSSTITFYVALFYDTNYQYKNTVSKYLLYFYAK